MIIQETYELNGRQFVRTYSDANRYIVGGEPYTEYTEANDPVEFNRVYTEGDPIPSEGTESDEILSILLGDT